MYNYYGEKDPMQELVGRTIDSLSISDDETVLVFDTDMGPIVFGTDGDCCSRSWFNDVLGVNSLMGAKVTEVEEVPMAYLKGKELEKYDRYEVIKVYGYKLKTTHGYADLIFRNSSNGYYGGTVYRMKGAPNRLTYRPLAEDWQA